MKNMLMILVFFVSPINLLMMILTHNFKHNLTHNYDNARHLNDEVPRKEQFGTPQYPRTKNNYVPEFLLYDEFLEQFGAMVI